MSTTVRSQVNIALMLRDNLPAALRELDGQIRQAEQTIEELRRNRTTLTQVAIAAGIDYLASTDALPAAEKVLESESPTG